MTFATDTVWIRASSRVYTEAPLLDWDGLAIGGAPLPDLHDSLEHCLSSTIVSIKKAGWFSLQSSLVLGQEQILQVDSGSQAGPGSLLVLAGEHAPEVLVAWRSTVQHTQHVNLNIGKSKYAGFEVKMKKNCSNQIRYFLLTPGSVVGGAAPNSEFPLLFCH